MSKIEVQKPIGLDQVTSEDCCRAQRLAQLIRSYHELGGWHVQANSVSTDLLKEAQQCPEQHKDLLGRVAGYSAFFVELSLQVQNDIIDRSEYAF